MAGPFEGFLRDFNQQDAQFRPRDPVLSQPDTGMGKLVGKRQALSLMDLLSVIPPGKAFGLAKGLARTAQQALRPKLLQGGVKGSRKALTEDQKMKQLRRIDTGIRSESRFTGVEGSADFLSRIQTLRGAAEKVRPKTEDQKIDLAFDKQEADEAIPVDIPGAEVFVLPNIKDFKEPPKVFDFPASEPSDDPQSPVGEPGEVVNLDAVRGAKDMQGILDALRDGRPEEEDLEVAGDLDGVEETPAIPPLVEDEDGNLFVDFVPGAEEVEEVLANSDNIESLTLERLKRQNQREDNH